MEGWGRSGLWSQTDGPVPARDRTERPRTPRRARRSGQRGTDDGRRPVRVEGPDRTPGVDDNVLGPITHYPPPDPDRAGRRSRSLGTGRGHRLPWCHLGSGATPLESEVLWDRDEDRRGPPKVERDVGLDPLLGPEYGSRPSPLGPHVRTGPDVHLAGPLPGSRDRPSGRGAGVEEVSVGSFSGRPAPVPTATGMFGQVVGRGRPPGPTSEVGSILSLQT